MSILTKLTRVKPLGRLWISLKKCSHWISDKGSQLENVCNTHFLTMSHEFNKVKID